MLLPSSRSTTRTLRRCFVAMEIPRAFLLEERRPVAGALQECEGHRSNPPDFHGISDRCRSFGDFFGIRAELNEDFIARKGSGTSLSSTMTSPELTTNVPQIEVQVIAACEVAHHAPATFDGDLDLPNPIRQRRGGCWLDLLTTTELDLQDAARGRKTSSRHLDQTGTDTNGTGEGDLFRLLRRLTLGNHHDGDQHHGCNGARNQPPPCPTPRQGLELGQAMHGLDGLTNLVDLFVAHLLGRQ